MSINELNYPVAQTIVKIMEQRGLKQCSVAKLAGYSDQRFNDMLNGRYIIKVSDIPRIAGALRVTPNELYGEVKNQDAS